MCKEAAHAFTEDVCGAGELLIWSHFFPLITSRPDQLRSLLTDMQLPQFDHLANLTLILFLQHSRTGDCEVNR